MRIVGGGAGQVGSSIADDPSNSRVVVVFAPAAAAEELAAKL